MWAHVAAGVITAWGDLPSLWWDGSRQTGDLSSADVGDDTA